ncbi:MAG: DUF3883 domain-containing protein [Pyrobaculum sp.]
MELKKKGGVFSITLLRNEVIIKHNGKPFDARDLDNLCRVGGSKKPREGYKGYIGIGFKSVFRVSSKVYVHSNNTQLGNIAFKFDKNYWNEIAEELKKSYGIEPSDVPYQVVPILVEPAEPLEPGETLFRILLDDPNVSGKISEYLEKIPHYMFLFLEYINRVEIEDRIKNYKKVIEWKTTSLETIDDGINVEKVELNINGKVEKFLVFKKREKVPDYVKTDEITRSAKREDVEEREIAAAFALDELDNPKPLEGAEFWGIYSFMPLSESASGLKFLIQTDLIVHPGRRSVNYEALWNQWLMERVADLLRKIIKYMANRYSNSYLPLFEYKDVGGPFFEKLVKPNIVKVIEEELKDPPILCSRGRLISLSKAVIYDENIKDLIEEGLFTENDLRYVYGETGTDLCLAGVDIKLRSQDKAKRLKPEDLLNENLIKSKLGESREKALNFLTKIYKKVGIPRDESKRYVITKANNVVTAKNAYLGEIPNDVAELSKRYPEIDEFLRRLHYVDDYLRDSLGAEFLEKLGVKKVDFQEVCNKVLLAKLIADKPPDKEELLIISAILRKAGMKRGEDIWVLTRGGEVGRSSEVYYPYEYFKPIELLEKLGFKFLDIDEYTRYGSEVEWRKFFEEFTPIRGKTYPYPVYIHDVIMRIIEVLRSSTNKNELINYTRLLKRLYISLKKLWWWRDNIVNVVTDEGIRRSDEAFLHSRYRPIEDWMKWKEFYRVGPFVSDEYIDDNDIQGWREFLISVLSVKEKAKEEQIERFAEKYVEDELVKRDYIILSRHGEGFDYEVKKEGSIILIEVKGRRKKVNEIDEIILTEAETRKALDHGRRYWVAVVTDIPNNPTLYVVKNPIKIERIIIKRDDLMRGEVWD